ncbi:MAG: sigma-70 family RNA polymerase sigma factor [Elusimicrobiaceae bacterium]|nr:sigma-70 family RNA polymerase sigma factor [Elusimicrobiaceae bacterium]
MNVEQVYNDYFSRVYAYIRSRVYNETHADDICCEVFQTVFEKHESFDPKKGNIEQWLFTIARNKVNSHLRLYHIRNFFSFSGKEEIIPLPEKKPLDKLGQDEEINQLHAALAVLSSKERDLISLKFFSSLNNREIAAATSLSESNVGTLLYRAMQKLRAVLEDL